MKKFIIHLYVLVIFRTIKRVLIALLNYKYYLGIDNDVSVIVNFINFNNINVCVNCLFYLFRVKSFKKFDFQEKNVRLVFL